MPKNEARVSNAQEALEHYVIDLKREHFEESEEEITDLITDLLLLAHKYGYDQDVIDAILNMARTNFESEKGN